MEREKNMPNDMHRRIWCSRLMSKIDKRANAQNQIMLFKATWLSQSCRLSMSKLLEALQWGKAPRRMPSLWIVYHVASPPSRILVTMISLALKAMNKVEILKQQTTFQIWKLQNEPFGEVTIANDYSQKEPQMENK